MPKQDLNPGILSPPQARGGVGLALLSSFLLAFHPVAAQSAPSSRQMADQALIQQAGLRWIVEKARQHPSGALKTVCFRGPDLEKEWGEGGPLPAFDRDRIVAFMDRDFGLEAKEGSGCEVRSAGGGDGGHRLYFDAESGGPAALLTLHEPQITGAAKAEIDLTYLVGEKWGEDFRCALDRTGSGWVVVLCKRTGAW